MGQFRPSETLKKVAQRAQKLMFSLDSGKQIEVCIASTKKMHSKGYKEMRCASGRIEKWGTELGMTYANLYSEND